MSELNPIPDSLGAERQREAEKKAIEKFGSDIVTKLNTQWSQLVAWSWREPDDYEEGKKPSDAQETLRKGFIDAVKDLARYCAAEHYCPGMFKERPIPGMIDILSSYLNGGKRDESGLTLRGVYEQLTNQNDYVFDGELTQSFIWVVTVDRLDSWLAGYNKKKDKFVMVLGYPPRSSINSLALDPKFDEFLKPKFHTVLSLMDEYELGEIEKKVRATLGSERKAIDITQRFTTQWSQLVAWSWLEPNDYKEGEKPSSEQENLRKAFISAVEDLARSCIANCYSPIEEIYTKSDLLSQYLNGKIPQSGLTLPELYKDKLRYRSDMTDKPEYVFDKEYTQNFIWMITVDRFHGWFVGYDEANNKFLMVLAYPPRPAFSPSVLEPSDLIQWSKNRGKGGYIVPNPYIPTCAC